MMAVNKIRCVKLVLEFRPCFVDLNTTCCELFLQNHSYCLITDDVIELVMSGYGCETFPVGKATGPLMGS